MFKSFLTWRKNPWHFKPCHHCLQTNLTNLNGTDGNSHGGRRFGCFTVALCSCRAYQNCKLLLHNTRLRYVSSLTLNLPAGYAQCSCVEKPWPAIRLVALSQESFLVTSPRSGTATGIQSMYDSLNEKADLMSNVYSCPCNCLSPPLR